MSRRKVQSDCRSFNLFNLSRMPRPVKVVDAYLEELEIIKSIGIVVPDVIYLSNDNLPTMPTGPWNKRLTCGHIVRDKCGGCGQYRI